MEKKRMFTRADVNKIFKHISPRTLRAWIEMGLIEWVEGEGDRRGIKRLFSVENCYQIGIVAELAAVSIPLPEIKRLVGRYFSGGNLKKNMEKVMGVSTAYAEAKGEKSPVANLRLFEPQDTKALMDSIQKMNQRELEEFKRKKQGFLPTIVLMLNVPGILFNVDLLIEQAVGQIFFGPIMGIALPNALYEEKEVRV